MNFYSLPIVVSPISKIRNDLGQARTWADVCHCSTETPASSAHGNRKVSSRSAHNGAEGSEFKQAADAPDECNAVWLRFSDSYGRRVSLPRLLTHLKRELSEAKWTETKWSTHTAI